MHQHCHNHCKFCAPPLSASFQGCKKVLGTSVKLIIAGRCLRLVIEVLSLLPLAHLSEADLSIIVFIDLFDHGLEGKVGLGLTKLLHHQLQLHEVDEVTVIYIVSVRNERERKKGREGEKRERA